MYEDEKPRFPLCIIETIYEERGYYISEDRFVSMTGIKIYCRKDQRKEIETLFRNVFDPLWIKARKYVDRYYGGCPQERDDIWPYHISDEEEYGIFIAISGLVLRSYSGEAYDTLNLGQKVFAKTLDSIKERYPSVMYYGYICEKFSDKRTTFWRDFCLDYNMVTKDKEYDFISEYLDVAMRNKFFLRLLKRNMENLYEEDYIELMDFYYHFQKYMSSESYKRAIDMIFELTEKHDKSIQRRCETIKSAISYHLKQLEANEIYSIYDEEDALSSLKNFETEYGELKDIKIFIRH